MGGGTLLTMFWILFWTIWVGFSVLAILLSSFLIGSKIGPKILGPRAIKMIITIPIVTNELAVLRAKCLKKLVEPSSEEGVF